MKFFDKNFPEKLTSSILVSEVVGKKVKLKSHGKEFMGLCPFHNEKTPSFTVNDQKGFYHCFGCQAHGNIIDFVMQTEATEFKDAVVQLANDFAIEIPWQESTKEFPQNNYDKSYEILERICQIFQENLKEAVGANARNYLQNRGFNKKIIEEFRLGYAINSYDFLHKKLLKEGFSEQDLLKTGIIAKNNSKKLYDKFRNRVIFPILDRKNRVIAYGGRVLDDSLPKYLNSAETAIFKKNQTLYNISGAKKAIFDKRYVVVVEGYADVISLASEGVKNVVAGLGTALGKIHLQELFRITDRIVLCFDGDGAGLSAAKRVSEIALPLISSAKNIDFTLLPEKLDPDDYVKKYGASALTKEFEENSVKFSQALFDFAVIDLGIRSKSSIKPEEKAKIENNLTKKLELISDPLLKKYFSQFFNDILYKIGKKTNFKSKNGKKYANNSENLQNYVKIGRDSVQNNLSRHSESDILAQNIIALLLKYPTLANYGDENFNIHDFSFENEELTGLKDEIIEKIEENPQKSEKNLLLTLENYAQSNYNVYIKALIDGAFSNFKELPESDIQNKMRLLLLKYSLILVQQQYKQALSKIDEIDTHQTAVIDQKITEIFAYKNSLEHKIIALEKELI